MTFVDSSVFIASFLPHDTQHAKAQRTLRTLKHIDCHEYVLLEVATVLRLKGEGELAATFIDLMERGSDVTLVPSSPALLADTSQLFKRSPTSKLSFVDTMLVVLSRNHQVVTFDQALLQAMAKQKR